MYWSMTRQGAIDVYRVFEPFYRMDSRTESGSGIGLYVVKLLADKLGWKVQAETKNGTFSVVVYMPLFILKEP